jgi:hypothetical protein
MGLGELLPLSFSSFTQLFVVYSNCLAPPSLVLSRRKLLEGIAEMPARSSGRLEKRIRLAIAVEISSPRDPAATERTTTENVCSLGLRVLTQRAKEMNERLMINSLAGDLRTLARVVYCQRLPDGRFGVGLQFQGLAVDWPRGSFAVDAV